MTVPGTMIRLMGTHADLLTALTTSIEAAPVVTTDEWVTPATTEVPATTVDVTTEATVDTPEV